MASINGIWFLLIGLVVTIISYFNEDLSLFLYVGMAFIVYGAFKLALKYMTSQKEPAQPKRNPQQPIQPQQTPPQHYYCRNCGRKLFMQDNFCTNCGMRQR